MRIGWAGVIGFIPWIGDLIALFFALQLLSKAEQIEGGLPSSLRFQMKKNITFDFTIGLIPIVGDFINVIYKCNLRNFVLLEKHLVDKYRKAPGASAKPGAASKTAALGKTASPPARPTPPARPSTTSSANRSKPELPPRELKEMSTQESGFYERDPSNMV